MEYLRGVDLAGELTRRRMLMPGEAVDYVLQACEALAEAHANEIVHRDIKSANLFLTTRLLQVAASGGRLITYLVAIRPGGFITAT